MDHTQKLSHEFHTKRDVKCQGVAEEDQKGRNMYYE